MTLEDTLQLKKSSPTYSCSRTHKNRQANGGYKIGMGLGQTIFLQEDLN